MAQLSDQEEPLLSNWDAKKKNTPLVLCLLKWVLKILMWVTFIVWITFILVYPSPYVNTLFQTWTSDTEGNIFGRAGGECLPFGAPVFIIAILAVLYYIVVGKEEFEVKKSPKQPKFRLWTFPFLVNGPFGIVSAAEFIVILLSAVYLIWANYGYVLKHLELMDEGLNFKQQSIYMLESTGHSFGTIGLLFMIFMFFPVARGSVFLRLIDIPFEHAVRYHVWLGNLTMVLFTLHGLCYIIGWSIQRILLKEILEWEDVADSDVANIAGAIALLTGLFIWVTSLPLVRRLNFELFFFTHHLYIIFFIFMALHVGDYTFTTVAGGIFIFMLDRFLRFWQSRRTVDIISATCFPCGAVKLVLSKPENLRYNALSFIFLQIRELSWLQWHPFSVSSSPLDGKYHVSVLIKVLGEWTAKLKGSISNLSLEETQKEIFFQLNPKITASVEGPYGHESPYHLTYEKLILVAGGIGISPFLAILSDIQNRVKARKPCLPRNILVVWAVKRSNEIPLLSTMHANNFSDKLYVDIRIYVTRESEPTLEEGEVDRVINSSVYPVSNRHAMSALVATGNDTWFGIYVISSIVGFILLLGLSDIFYINRYDISSMRVKASLFVACMVAGVLVFGGFVIYLWHRWERKSSAGKASEEDRNVVDNVHQNLASSSSVRYGSRPDIGEIFGSISESWGNVDVGVIVCGPPTLEASVAKECRSHTLSRQSHQPIFHFNSHSFEL